MPTEKLLINGYFEKIGFEDSFWTIKINGEKTKKKGKTPCAKATNKQRGIYGL